MKLCNYFPSQLAQIWSKTWTNLILDEFLRNMSFHTVEVTIVSFSPPSENQNLWDDALFLGDVGVIFNKS